MNALVAVLFLAVAANAVKHPLPSHMSETVSTKGEQYKLYEKFSKSITLNDDDQDETFIGLNIKKDDQEINKADLDIFYWHDELIYARKKFLNFVDDNNDDKIERKELEDEFDEKPVRVALIECHYLLSKGLKQSCFADQLLTYASLVLDEDDVKAFHKFVAGTDGKISKEEAEKLKGKKNVDKLGTAEELGAYTGPENGVSFEEFKDYVTQESINDDFRRCRKGTANDETGNIDFTSSCLLEELVEYTNDDLTEMDIAVLYSAVDKNGKDGITKAEIKELPNIKLEKNADEIADKVMKLLDMSLTTPEGGTPSVDYGEFRTYMRSPTVLIQAERECTEPKGKQKEELDCLYDLFVRLVVQEHDAIWLVVPDLEQQIAFEIVDTKGKGMIKQADLPWEDDRAEARFISEFDADKEGYVCLEEWNEHMDIPHMVYGTGDCLLQPRTKGGRDKCYPHEVEDMMNNIKYFEKEFWPKWFKHYDDNNDKVIDVTDNNEADTRFGSTELEKLFLGELGQGDNSVTLFEFTWYVKQQELADRYKAIVNDRKQDDLDEFHKVLMNWVQNDITEYDIQKFFDVLDGDDNHELDEKDFGESLWPVMKELLAKIDGVDPDGDVGQTVNFREFWLWLNVQTNPGQTKKTFVKDIFEEKCTTKIDGENQQQREIDCYVTYFKKNAKTLSKLF